MSEYGHLCGFSFPPRVYFGAPNHRKAPPMTTPTDRPPNLTRGRLLFGLGSAAGAGAICPALAVAASAVPLIGSENRVSQAELDRIVARHQLWLDRKTGGAHANFSGRDLSGLKFGRWDLRHAASPRASLFVIHATDSRSCYCNFMAPISQACGPSISICTRRASNVRACLSADLGEADLSYSQVTVNLSDSYAARS